jgi:hypothetical protein
MMPMEVGECSVPAERDMETNHETGNAESLVSFWFGAVFDPVAHEQQDLSVMGMA